MITIGECMKLIKRIEKLENKKRPKCKGPPFRLFYEGPEALEEWYKESSPNMPLPVLTSLDDHYQA